MMKIVIKGVVLGLLSGALHSAAFASDPGITDEAVTQVKKAIAYYKKEGEEKAFAEINNPKASSSPRTYTCPCPNRKAAPCWPTR